MENCRKESAHKVAKRSASKTHLKPHLTTSISTDSWEQAAQDQTKWRCLINKGATQFELKRICEAERKRKEWKARAKNSSPDSALSESEFTCSICNRQFRAKIGILSHQRTHNHTRTLNIKDLRWSFLVLRDEQSKGGMLRFSSQEHLHKEVTLTLLLT